ncbi:MAG: hypothetical protein KKF50_01395 [Nanoarchaeota archaeon]|nr:hypothetical protein [Nanoarchaeota archaeon]
MKIQFKEFQKVISQFNKRKLKYYVFGGFCYKGLGEEWKAKDLDLVCFEKDLILLNEIFDKMGYHKKFIGRKIVYHKNSFEVDVRLIRIVGDVYQVRSNRTIDYLSSSIFKYKNYGEINNFKFRIVPNEFLLLYRKGHSERYPDKNRKLNKIIDKIELKCKKIKVCRQRRFKKMNDKYAARARR